MIQCRPLRQCTRVLCRVTADALTNNLTLVVAMGLLLGKLIGVSGSAYLTIRFGFADVPMGAGRVQVLGISLLCGIGFTMSLFIGMLAFALTTPNSRKK